MWQHANRPRSFNEGSGGIIGQEPIQGDATQNQRGSERGMQGLVGNPTRTRANPINDRIAGESQISGTAFAKSISLKLGENPSGQQVGAQGCQIRLGQVGLAIKLLHLLGKQHPAGLGVI
jgi:hypothetical protein